MDQADVDAANETIRPFRGKIVGVARPELLPNALRHGPRVSKGAVQRAIKARQIREVPQQHEIQGVIVTTVERKAVPRMVRADVLKIMRRVHQRIADRRWSGVPT